jgi:hypothetical protein
MNTPVARALKFSAYKSMMLRGNYSFRGGLAIETHFDSANFFIPDFDVEEDFIGDNRPPWRFALSEDKVCSEEYREEDWGHAGTEHGGDGWRIRG